MPSRDYQQRPFWHIMPIHSLSLDNHRGKILSTCLLDFGLVLLFEKGLFWVIILLPLKMIKRCTPNKNFPRERREHSCCGFCPGDAQRGEVTLYLHPKKAEQARSFTAAKGAHRPNLKLGGGKSPSNTSQNSTPSSPHPSQTPSYTKTFLQTAATIDRPPLFESFPERIVSRQLCSPLVRLRQRLFRVNSLQASPHPSLNKRMAHFLQGDGGEGGEGRRVGEGSVSLAGLQGRPFEEQAQGLCLSILREIEQYKRQYEALLSEERSLLEEREGNRRHYEGLVGRIRQKEEELRLLQEMRKEEVEVLRREMEEFVRRKEVRDA